MSNKKLVTLIVVAAVLVGLAYLSSSNKKMNPPRLVGKPLLPGIDLSQVARIETGMENGEKLVLASSDSGWVIPSFHNYPADIAKIRENLLKLKDLKVGQVATGKEMNQATLVDLQDETGKSLATLRLGDKKMRQPTGEMAQYGGGGYPDGRYVAAGEGKSVVLVKDSLDAFDGDPKNWTDTQIASIPAADVMALKLTQGQTTLNLEKKDGSWILADLGKEEDFDGSKSYSLESALNYLNFNSVADPALSDAQLGMTTGALFQATLKSGERYTATIGNVVSNSTDRYFRIRAAFTPTGTNETVNAELKAKVEKFNETTAMWTYTISSYSAENMTKKRADLIKAKETKPAEAKPEAPAKAKPEAPAKAKPDNAPAQAGTDKQEDA